MQFVLASLYIKAFAVQSQGTSLWNATVDAIARKKTLQSGCRENGGLYLFPTSKAIGDSSRVYSFLQPEKIRTVTDRRNG